MKLRVNLDTLLLAFIELQATVDERKVETTQKVDYLEKRLEMFESKLDDIADSTRDHSYTIQIQGEVLNQKANKAEINKVERMFGHYTPYNDFKDMQKWLLEEYTKNDEFEIAQRNISDLRDTVSLKANKKEVDSEINSLFADTQRRFNHYATKTELNDNISVIKDDINTILSKISTAAEDLQTMKTYSDLFNNKLKTKIEYNDLKSEVDKINEKFINCCSYDHIKKIEDKIDPFIEKVRKQVESFEVDNIKSKEILRRFDEVLWEKASKFNLEQIQLEFKNYIHNQQFEAFKEHLKEFQHSLHLRIDSTKSDVHQAKIEIQKAMEISISKAVTDVKKKLFGRITSTLTI